MIKCQCHFDIIQNLNLKVFPFWILTLIDYALVKCYDLNYIEKFEEIYCPIIYHDTDYAQLLMVKCDCLDILNEPNKYELLPKIANWHVYSEKSD